MRWNGLSLIFVFSVLTMNFANAFPEMVRHGYTNCTACHVAANGGGILTPYGSTLSEEVLSTWHFEGEGSFLYTHAGKGIT